jgi:hypothetical protein
MEWNTRLITNSDADIESARTGGARIGIDSDALAFFLSFSQ